MLLHLWREALAAVRALLLDGVIVQRVWPVECGLLLLLKTALQVLPEDLLGLPGRRLKLPKLQRPLPQHSRLVWWGLLLWSTTHHAVRVGRRLLLSLLLRWRLVLLRRRLVLLRWLLLLLLLWRLLVVWRLQLLWTLLRALLVLWQWLMRWGLRGPHICVRCIQVR